MLPHLGGVLVEEVSAEGGVLRIVARTPGAVPASCPDCGAPSLRWRSGYQRRLADGVVGGRQVSIDLTTRRLFCDHQGYARVTLAEQVDGLTDNRALRASDAAASVLAEHDRVALPARPENASRPGCRCLSAAPPCWPWPWPCLIRTP